MNLNKFDNMHFIKKLKNKKILYMQNYKNKISYNKNDYKQFLYHFERYKSNDNFIKQNINTENLTFDDFIYSDINISDLVDSINKQKKKLKN